MKTSFSAIFAMIALAAVGLSGCLPPPPLPVHGQSAALGVSVEKQWASSAFGSIYADRVYFVRWSDSTDLTKPAEVIPSNFIRGGMAYLLNAKPGRYSAVAATDFAHMKSPGKTEGLAVRSPRGGGMFRAGRAGAVTGSDWSIRMAGAPAPVRLAGVRRSRPEKGLGTALAGFAGRMDFGITISSSSGRIAQAGGTDRDGAESNGDNEDEYSAQTTYFSEELIRQTMVSLGAGQFQMMGRFVVEMEYGLEHPDKTQEYYFKTIHPTVDDPNGMPFFYSGNSDYSKAKLAAQQRDNKAKTSLLKRALEDLRGTAWAPLIEKQLQKLK